LKHGKLFILLALFILVTSILSYVALHFKNYDDVSLSLFELPKSLPYLYCEFNGHPGITGLDERSVLLIFWQNDKMHRIKGTAINEEWDFTADTPNARRVIEKANQMHTRKTRIMPKPGERNIEGRILANDAGFISRITHSPKTIVHFEAELSKLSDDEYIMNFNIMNIESIIPAAWLKDLIPIRIKGFPIIKGTTYAHLASNITLMELIPQIKTFINKNAKNRIAASSLRSMRGELYVSIGSGNALWDGKSVPASLLRFHLRNNAARQTLFDFIYDFLNKKYELFATNNGYFSYTPSSIWLSQSEDYLETGVIDRNSITKNEESALPEPPNEALIWISFSPRYLVEAINNFITQIIPDIDFKETLDRLTNLDNCTFTLNSIKSGAIKWKNYTTNSEK